MIEVSGVPKLDREDCREIIYKYVNLYLRHKEIKIEIAHRIKNRRHYCQVQKQNIT